jgi:DNA-binding MarR family transcriptional regulator
MGRRLVTKARAAKRPLNIRHSVGAIPQQLVERHRDAFPEFEPEAAQIAFAIRALATSINDAAASWLAPHGLTPAKMNVVLVLECTPEGLPLSKLGALLHSRSPHVTALIDAMEAERLVRRVQNPTDRRSFIAQLTRKGRRLFEKTFLEHCHGNSRLIATLTAAERATLIALLAKLYANVESVSAPG